MNDDQQSEVGPPRRLPRIWPALVAPWAGLAVTIVLQIVVAAALVMREFSRGVAPAELAERAPALFLTPGIFILTAACGQVAFGLVAIVSAWLSKTRFTERLGLRPAAHSWTIYPLVIIGSLAPTAAGFGLAYLLTLVIPPDTSVALLYENMTLAWAAPFVIFIGLAPGFCEELLFRGYMQRRLLQRWRPWTSITVTSVVFAVFHIMPHTMVLALLLGLWFGVIAWRTGSIWPCIACHAFVNSSVNFWRMIVKFNEIPTAVEWGVPIVAVLAGVYCFVVACRRLYAIPPIQPGALAEQAA